MVRELLIEMYLLFVKILFSIFKILPIQDKVTFVASFKGNNIAIYNEMQRLNFSSKLVFLCKKSCYRSLKNSVDEKVYQIESKNILHEIIGIYHIATSRKIIVDNYYGFLAAVSFKKNVECIQIWHAAGAIKTFGLKDHTIEKRTKRAKERFKKVYKNFHKVVVGSDEFAKIFMEAFDLSEENMLPIGIPRTDFFYDHEKHEEIKEKFFRKYPALIGKKIILYAPTYRDYEEEQELHLNIDLLYEHLKEEYALLIRFHPSVTIHFENEKYKDFVFDFSYYHDINELLIVADYLISDYSSVPFEFSILEKPMIFYPYDLQKYEKERGIWRKYEEMVPGPIVMSTEEIIHVIKNHDFDLDKIKEFAKLWNTYSKGRSCQAFVQYVSTTMPKTHVQDRSVETNTSL